MMVLGSIVGWIVGVLWFMGLVLFVFGPTIRVTRDADGWREEEIPTSRRLGYAFIIGIPWAIPGAIAGLVGGVQRGYGAPIGALIGSGVAGILTLIGHRMDGWLVLTIPLYCIIGAIIGLIIGAALQSSINSPNGAKCNSPGR